MGHSIRQTARLTHAPLCLKIQAMLSLSELALFLVAALSLLALVARRGRPPGPNPGLEGSSAYFPQLDGLRFFAFLLVLWHHFPVYHDSNLGWFLAKFGWIGVDLFFT